MSPIISEILKITVDPATFDLDSPAFAKCREVAVRGGAKEQYYGMCTDERDKLLWVIHWPDDMNPAEYKGPNESEDFRESVQALDVNASPSSWYLPFESADLVRPALTAPLCQLCSIHLDDTSDKAMVSGPLEKTFTDCYGVPGFIGGNWGTATNDVKRNYYYLGWETREHRNEYAKTPLFFEEINKLLPHMDEGTTNYTKMAVHDNNER